MPPTSSPSLPGARDRRNEAPADINKPLVEGIINPSPKQLDPKNPAGAPILEAVHDDDDRALAHEELTDLLRKDRAEMGPDERRDHDRRVHELHYAACGEPVPSRSR